MRPTSSVLFPMLSLCVALAACDDAEDAAPRCIDVGADELRSTAPEGELQGTSYQGISYQGYERQGIDVQGTPLEARDFAGMRLALADGSAAITLRDGRLVAGERGDTEALRDVELVATSVDGRRFSVSIAGVASVDGSERIEIHAEGAAVCAPGKAGMFVAGTWDDTGAHSVAGDELTYACMDGVIAKCVSWGYAPWKVGADVHAACTRLARADYCGDGQAWTLDGTRIDVYDSIGVQSPVHDPELSFEAAWGVDGAICVDATRYAIHDEDDRPILPACFADLPRCASLDEARKLGAVLVDDSAHTPIEACAGG